MTSFRESIPRVSGKQKRWKRLRCWSFVALISLIGVLRFLASEIEMSKSILRAFFGKAQKNRLIWDRDGTLVERREKQTAPPLPYQYSSRVGSLERSRTIPSFLILGTQKAGTTSLYEFINQHPQVVKAKIRETHCLDWRWNESITSTNAHRESCLKFYNTKELALNSTHLLTGESSPSYLLDTQRVIPRLKRIFPYSTIKFFVMVRDPVARAFSHYQMVDSTPRTIEQKKMKTRGTNWSGLSFQQVVHEHMRIMQDFGLIPYFDIENGIMDRKAFEKFSGSTEENDAWRSFVSDIPLRTGSHSLIARGLYEMQLRPWLNAFNRSQFMIIRLEDFGGDGVSRVMDQVWRHLDLPPHRIDDEEAKNTRSYRPMNKTVEQYLMRFYSPHNVKFAEVVDCPDWDYKLD